MKKGVIGLIIAGGVLLTAGAILFGIGISKEYKQETKKPEKLEPNIETDEIRYSYSEPYSRRCRKGNWQDTRIYTIIKSNGKIINCRPKYGTEERRKALDYDRVPNI